jgi:hypothetical protein
MSLSSDASSMPHRQRPSSLILAYGSTPPSTLGNPSMGTRSYSAFDPDRRMEFRDGNVLVAFRRNGTTVPLLTVTVYEQWVEGPPNGMNVTVYVRSLVAGVQFRWSYYPTKHLTIWTDDDETFEARVIGYGYNLMTFQGLVGTSDRTLAVQYFLQPI